jgi:fructose-bisphosphate aldolase class I
MKETVQKLLAEGHGILAADESSKTIDKRFAALGIESTPETHRKYREMLLTTPGIENYLGGVIFFDETLHQSTQGKPFPEYLTERGIVPGIKVDEGLEPFNGTEEQVTKGLDGLDDRLKAYREMGLKFTKWRAAIQITDIFPSESFLDETVERMSSFAEISIKNDFVPIVEPEILLTGTHTTTRCDEIETKVLQVLFEKLKSKNIDLTNVLLKTSMVLPGKDSGVKALPLEVANATLRALGKSVPSELAGIVFLSGGQTPDEATNNLNEIVKLKGSAPWELSFSFARALQSEALEVWCGKDENITSAQEKFIKRLEMVSNARNGKL